jgi:hypothetical protein
MGAGAGVGASGIRRYKVRTLQEMFGVCVECYNRARQQS